MLPHEKARSLRRAVARLAELSAEDSEAVLGALTAEERHILAPLLVKVHGDDAAETARRREPDAAAAQDAIDPRGADLSQVRALVQGLPPWLQSCAAMALSHPAEGDGVCQHAPSSEVAMTRATRAALAQQLRDLALRELVAEPARSDGTGRPQDGTWWRRLFRRRMGPS